MRLRVKVTHGHCATRRHEDKKKGRSTEAGAKEEGEGKGDHLVVGIGASIPRGAAAEVHVVAKATSCVRKARGEEEREERMKRENTPIIKERCYRNAKYKIYRRSQKKY